MFRHKATQFPAVRTPFGREAFGGSQKPFEVLSGRRGPSAAGLEEDSDKRKEVKDENRAREEKHREGWGTRDMGCRTEAVHSGRGSIFPSVCLWSGLGASSVAPCRCR